MAPILFDLGVMPVGKYCDLACQGCFQREKNKNSFLASKSEVVCLLEDFGFSQCFIGGGEPLLHDNLEKILQGLSKRFFVRYLLTHGFGLANHLYLGDYVETIVVSIDPMHKKAMERKYGGVLYPSDILSSIDNYGFRKNIRINSVVCNTNEMPFFHKLAQYIARSKNVKGWNIYRNTNSKISDKEYLRIVAEINDSYGLDFQVEPKIPSEKFIQILIFSDLSVESYSFNASGKLVEIDLENLALFQSKEEFLGEIGRLHGKTGAFSQIYSREGK